MVHDSKRFGRHGNQKVQLVESLKSAASKDATARAPEGTQNKEWDGGKDHGEEGARDQEATHSSSTTVEMNAQTKKRQTVISPALTERRIVVPPEVLHDTRICIEDLDFDDSDSDREMQDEVRRRNAQTEATWVKEASKLLKRDLQGPRMES